MTMNTHSSVTHKKTCGTKERRGLKKNLMWPVQLQRNDVPRLSQLIQFNSIDRHSNSFLNGTTKIVYKCTNLCIKLEIHDLQIPLCHPILDFNTNWRKWQVGH
jgi:hypothetical protein